MYIWIKWIYEKSCYKNVIIFFLCLFCDNDKLVCCKDFIFVYKFLKKYEWDDIVLVYFWNFLKFYL